MQNAQEITKSSLLQIVVIFSMLSLVMLACQSLQIGNAQTTAIKSLNVKAELDEKVIKLGESQKIKFTVVDSTSKQPVSGAQIRTTVTYPGGELVRVLNTISDSSGHASVSIPVNKSTRSDTVTVDILVTLTGFTDTAFSIPFAAISKDISK
jgi:hypothetical protein